MSNLTDFLESMICALDNPGTRTVSGTVNIFKTEDGILSLANKAITNLDAKITKDLSPEEKKIAQREYLRNYMREYKKTYVQPEINKSHATKRRRKYGTALITSARIRKNAEKNGYIITKNCYKVKKEQTDETENKVRKPNSSDDVQK